MENRKGGFKKNYWIFGIIIVALVVITLFVPCLANFFVMIKERGAKTAFLMLSFILPFSFLVGGVLRYILQLVSI